MKYKVFHQVAQLIHYNYEPDLLVPTQNLDQDGISQVNLNYPCSKL